MKNNNEISEIGRLLGPSSIRFSGFSPNIRQIKDFSNIFPSLEDILKKSELTILENIEIYNENLSRIYRKLPKLITTIWEVYRRNQIHNSLFLVDLNEIRTLIGDFNGTDNLLDIENLKLKKLDEYLQKSYIEGIKRIKDVISLNKFYPINEELPFELINIEEVEGVEYIIEREKTPLEKIGDKYVDLVSRTFSTTLINQRKLISKREIILPINIYTFENKFTKKKVKTHFDLSSNNIPYLKEFIIGPMSFETRSYFNDLANWEHLNKNYLDEYYKKINETTLINEDSL